MINEKTKDGQRTVKLHDPDLIYAVEQIAKEEGLHLYEVVETFIACGLNNEDPKEMIKERTISEVIIDRCGSGSFIDTLLENGYTLRIQPIAGSIEMYGKLRITFEQESEVK